MRAREEILGRVRTALQDVPATPEPVVAPRATHAPEAVLDLFVERVEDYRAAVERISAADLGSHLAGLLMPGERVMLPAGLPADVLEAVRTADAVPVPDDGLTPTDLDTTDTVITTAAVGIAETGTIVLEHGPGQGRRAVTLVPDRHLCLITADQVVPDVPDAVDRLVDAVLAGRPLTWISGPSATSDIELTRVEGVHGPRSLHVLLVH